MVGAEAAAWLVPGGTGPYNQDEPDRRSSDEPDLELPEVRDDQRIGPRPGRGRRRLRDAVRPGRGRAGRATAPSSAARSTSTRTASSRTRCPAPASGCRPTGRCRFRPTTSTCCSDAVPKAVAASGVSADDVIGIGTDFTACTVLPTLADGTPLCELPELADRPHAYVKLWKHHAAQPQADRINALAHERGRAVDRPVRRQALLGVGAGQGPAAARGGPGDLRARPSAGSRRPTGSSGSCAGRYVRNVCTAGYKAVYQDGRLSVPGLPRRAGRAVRRLLRARRCRTPLGELGAAAGGLTEQAAALDRSSARDRGRGRQRRRARDAAGRAVDRARPDAHDDGHLDLPRHERRRARRGARHVRGRPGRDHSGPVGLRGRAERRRRHLRLVAAHRRARGVRGTRPRAAGSTCTSYLTDPGRAAGGRRARPRRARLAQRQPVGARRPRALRPGRRPDTGHAAGGRLPRAARGDRVRHPDRSSSRSRRPACRCASSSSPAAWSRTRSSCRSTPT